MALFMYFLAIAKPNRAEVCWLGWPNIEKYESLTRVGLLKTRLNCSGRISRCCRENRLTEWVTKECLFIVSEV